MSSSNHQSPQGDPTDSPDPGDHDDSGGHSGEGAASALAHLKAQGRQHRRQALEDEDPQGGSGQ
jgi:hypothetical protein